MDLNSIDTSMGETGVDLIILGLDGKPTDATITLLSYYSNKARALMLEKVRKGESHDLSWELIIGWKNIKENKKVIEFSPEEAKRLYDKYTFISRQIDDFVTNNFNFLKKN